MGETHWREGKSFLSPLFLWESFLSCCLTCSWWFLCWRNIVEALGEECLPQMPRVPPITLWQQLAEPCWPGGTGEGAEGVPAAPLPLLGVLAKHPLAVVPAKAIPDPIPLGCAGERMRKGELCSPNGPGTGSNSCCAARTAMASSPAWAGVQNLAFGLSPAKDVLSILWPPRLSVHPAAALLGALGREPCCRPHERGDLASALAGKSWGAAARTGAGGRGVQSGGFRAARGPLGMAEGPKGVTPGMQSSALNGLEEGCPGVLGRARRAGAVKGSSCPQGCNGWLVVWYFATLILFIRLRVAPSFPSPVCSPSAATRYQDSAALRWRQFEA